MQVNTGLKILAGAVALAVSGGAFAQVTTTNIIVNVIDTTNNNSFVFDTSLPTSTSDPGPQSFNLASNSSYQTFLGARTSTSDTLVYSVVGYDASSDIDTTANATPKLSGSNANQASIAIAQFLAAIGNPSGGATYLASATTPTSEQWAASFDPTFATAIGTTDLNSVGTPEQFYAVTTTNTSAARGGATVAALASSWTLSTAGLLTYGQQTAVPLPAPVWLMISGLGLMGVVARRRQSVA